MKRGGVVGMSDIFYTNLNTDFSEKLKTIGVLEKITSAHNNRFVYRREDKEKKEEFFARYNTLLFIFRRYTLFMVLYSILSILFFLSSLKFAIVTLLVNFIYYLYVQPFSSMKKILRTSWLIKIYGVVAFLVSGYFLFSHTLPFDYILNISQGLLYSFLFIYVTFHLVGILNKYRNIYIRLEDVEDEVVFMPDSIFLWREK